MKQVIQESLGSLWLAATGSGQLLHMLRASRPNWSRQRCLMAAKYLLNSGLKGPAGFEMPVDYLSYLDKQLTRYSDKHPNTPSHEVADELSLQRWEKRWRRARRRSCGPEETADCQVGVQGKAVA